MAKKVYMYDPVTGEYRGEAAAHIDPVETEKREEIVWLLPANSTYLPPPIEEEGFVACFIPSEGWKLIEDNRGKIYRKSDAQEFYFNTLGANPSNEFTRLVPCEFPLWDEENNKWVVNTLEKFKQEAEVLIHKEIYKIIRSMAIKSLKSDGRLPEDWDEE